MPFTRHLRIAAMTWLSGVLCAHASISRNSNGNTSPAADVGHGSRSFMCTGPLLCDRAFETGHELSFPLCGAAIVCWRKHIGQSILEDGLFPAPIAVHP